MTAVDLTAAMEVDNPGEMSMAHAASTTSERTPMEVDDSISPRSTSSGLPDLVQADMPDTQVVVPPPPPSPLLTWSGRPRREYRLPKQFCANLPEPPAPAPITPSNIEANRNPIRQITLIVRDHLVTIMNSFGIWRDYPERPSVDPDSQLTLEELSNSYHHHNSHLQSHATTTLSFHSSESCPGGPAHWPFQNSSVHGVMQWLNNGQTAKSEVETTKLIHNVILSPNFNSANLTGFDAHRENQRLDQALSDSALRSQFVESSVEILVPSGECHVKGKAFEVPGLLH